MRALLFITTILAGLICMGLVPAEAAPQLMPGIAAKAQVGAVEDVGWRRRAYRRYGPPYAYCPPEWLTCGRKSCGAKIASPVIGIKVRCYPPQVP